MTPAGKKKGGEAAEFLKNLCEFLSNTDDLTPEEVRAELIEEGIDVDKMISKADSMVKAKISDEKRAWLREAPAKRISMLEKLNSIAPEASLTIADIKDKITQLVKSGKAKEFALAFRNFNQLSDDDLRKIYSDYIQLLNLKKETNEKKT